MKLIESTMTCLALVSLASVVPCLAQTSPAQIKMMPGKLSSQMIQAQVKQLLLSAGSAHRYISPQEKARNAAYLARISELDHSAAVNLHGGRYAVAESEAREAVSMDTSNGVGDEVLGQVLEAQGKNQEALQLYKRMIVDEQDIQPRNLLPYAMLLLKSGQWAQAVLAYNNALPLLPDVGPHPEIPTVHDGDLIRANSHFSPDVPEPIALATAIHIARGMVYNTTPSWSGESQDTEAMAEYAKALQSAPDNALANYYYGVGWQKLAPIDRAKFGTAQQAKAALQKAVKIGTADVKKAAEKALKDAG